MAFKIEGTNLENLLNRYMANMATIEKANKAKATDKDAPIGATIYTDQNEISVRATPDQVKADAIFYMIHLFHDFFEAEGLSRETWRSFLQNYYQTLNPENKDNVLLEVLQKYVTPGEREKLADNKYIEILGKKADLITLLQKERLDEKDLKRLLLGHFSHKGKKKGEVTVNQYAVAAIKDYENNPKVIQGAIEMKSRLYEILKARVSKSERREADRIMDFNEEDAKKNYSIGNYSKAATTYGAYEAQKEQLKKAA